MCMYSLQKQPFYNRYFPQGHIRKTSERVPENFSIADFLEIPMEPGKRRVFSLFFPPGRESHKISPHEMHLG